MGGCVGVVSWACCASEAGVMKVGGVERLGGMPGRGREESLSSSLAERGPVVVVVGEEDMAWLERRRGPCLKVSWAEWKEAPELGRTSAVFGGRPARRVLDEEFMVSGSGDALPWAVWKESPELDGWPVDMVVDEAREVSEALEAWESCERFL